MEKALGSFYKFKSPGKETVKQMLSPSCSPRREMLEASEVTPKILHSGQGHRPRSSTRWNAGAVSCARGFVVGTGVGKGGCGGQDLLGQLELPSSCQLCALDFVAAEVLRAFLRISVTCSDLLYFVAFILLMELWTIHAQVF